MSMISVGEIPKLTEITLKGNQQEIPIPRAKMSQLILWLCQVETLILLRFSQRKVHRIVASSSPCPLVTLPVLPLRHKVCANNPPLKLSSFSHTYCIFLSLSTTNWVPCNFQDLRLTKREPIKRISFSWLAWCQTTPSKGKDTIRAIIFDNCFLRKKSSITEGKRYPNFLP